MPSFEIVEFVDGKPRPFPAGVFPDGTTASSVIKTLSARYPNKKFQPRPIKDETRNWRVREQQRFTDGIYQPIGIGLPEIDGHFAHKALNNPKNVAYTPSIQHGQADKQISVHINKYLVQFYPNLAIAERKKIVWDYSGEDLTDGLHITQDGDLIEKAYRQGPNSCMSYPTEDFDGEPPFHPSRVYTGPDLAVAYLQVDDSITARTVVWPEKKIYAGIYGDADRLGAALKAEGYTREGYGEAWVGARMTSKRINDYDETYVCPYLDLYGRVYWDGKHLVVGEHPDFDSMYCQNTDGYCYPA